VERVAFPLIIAAMVLAGLWAWGSGDLHPLLYGIGALAFTGAVVGVYYLLLGLSMAAVLVRSVLALIPVGMFAGGLIYFVLVSNALSERVSQALIAAVVVAAGWVVAYLTGEWRRVGAEHERRRDIIRAAITELELIADHGARADWDKAVESTRDQFRKNARHDVFIFYGHQYVTLKRLVEQIEILNWGQIRPVMDIYQALLRFAMARFRAG